jgi:hypothetical protein
MASDDQTRAHDVPAPPPPPPPPPEDWREAVCRRPAVDRERARVDADTWNEVVRRRIAAR